MTEIGRTVSDSSNQMPTVSYCGGGTLGVQLDILKIQTAIFQLQN